MTDVKSSPFLRYICLVCGFIYDEALGDPDSGLEPGTRFEDIPDDWECPDCGVTKADFVLIKDPSNDSKTGSDDSRNSTASGMDIKANPDQLVVVGGGMAAWAVIERIRRKRPDLPIVMVTHCGGDVYSKPQLSTAVALGKTPKDLISASGMQQARKLNVELVAHTRVLAIERNEKRLITPRGGISYSQLILALGAQQATPAVQGDSADQIRQINDLSSYRRLRAQIDSSTGSNIVILGAGLIGCEFADDLSGVTHRIELVDNANYPLSRLLPEPLGNELAERLSAKNVQFHMKTTLTSVKKSKISSDPLIVELSNGKTLQASMVISALGLYPNIKLALDSGIAVNKGILVDNQLRTSDSNIYALGDCVEYQNKLMPYVKPLYQQSDVIASHLCDENSTYNGEASTIIIKTPSLPLSVYAPNEPGEWVEKIVEKDGATFVHISDGGRTTGFALSGTHTARNRQMTMELS